MNGLYGYPNGPSTMSHLGALAGDPSAELTLRRVISGEAHTELLALQRQQQQLNADIAAKELGISKMPDGLDKTKAKSLWESANSENQKAYRSLRDAINKYNEIVRKVRDYSLGAVAPKMMSGIEGMGWLVAVASAIAKLLPALSWLLVAYAGAVATTKMSLGSGRGYIDQTAGLVKETGVTITRTAWVVAGFFGLYLVYNALKDGEGWKQFSFRRVMMPKQQQESLTPELPLKQVSGGVED